MTRRRTVPRTRKPLAAALGAALAVPLLAAAPAAASPGAAGSQVTVTALKFTVQAGGRTCAVDADLYRPAGVDTAHPAPAVLTTNGFGGSKSDGTTDATARAFADRGYVALAYSGLGFGASGCLISLDDPGIDGRAASRLSTSWPERAPPTTEHASASSPRTGPGDPRVGMIGGSYGGAVRWPPPPSTTASTPSSRSSPGTT